MDPYTIEGLSRQEKDAAPAEQKMYELVGIVVHSGQASAGHYYSFIKKKRCVCMCASFNCDYHPFLFLLLSFPSLSPPSLSPPSLSPPSLPPFLPSSPSFNTSPLSLPSSLPLSSLLLPLFSPILPPFHCPLFLSSHFSLSPPPSPLTPPRAPPSSVIPEEEVLESNSGQWLRFNDILVDEFAMNDPAMEAECFGGSYKAKPNDRELLPPLLTCNHSCSTMGEIRQFSDHTPLLSPGHK